MDIAHKEFLEKETKENLIKKTLDYEYEINKLKEIEKELRTLITEKMFLIETLLKVIKYQNGLNDKE